MYKVVRLLRFPSAAGMVPVIMLFMIVRELRLLKLASVAGIVPFNLLLFTKYLQQHAPSSSGLKRNK